MSTRDVRFAVRTLLKAPGFTVVAVLVLGLAIGANTAVFSLVNGLLIKSAPGERRTTEVVGLYSRDRTRPDSYRDFSYPDFLDIRARNPVFSDVAGMTFGMVGYREGDQTRRVFAAVVSANYFSTFGARLAAGRAFSPREEAPGAGIPVAIVSHEYWKSRGFDPGIVGKTVEINSRPFTVVGIAPRGFTAADSIVSPEFWVPTGTYEIVANDMMRQGEHTTLPDRLNRCLMLYGRLKPGIDLTSTEPLLRTLSRQMEEAYPAENKNQVLLAHRLSRFSISTNPHDDSQVAGFSVLLMAMTAVVLAIACLNLANMLLARGTGRRKEIAIRLALGSGRVPIVGQLLVEGMLLALAGGVLGLVIAFWTTRLLVSSIAPVMPLLTIVVDPTPDLRVLVVTLGFCALSTLIFGLGPAWKLSRTDVVPELKEQGGETGRARRWPFSLRHVLVVGQVALSLALLTAAGLFARGAAKAADANPGFGLEQSVLLNVDPGMAGYDEAKGRETYRRLLERVRSLPGVRTASLAAVVPFGDMTMGRSVQKVGSEDGRPPEDAGDTSMSFGSGGGTPRDRGDSVGVNYYVVGADYFETLGIRLLRGRGFRLDEEESAAGASRVVIDETLARRLFPKGDAIGQYIRFVSSEAPTSGEREHPMEIIGIAAPIRHSLLDAEEGPQVYVPFGAHYQTNMFVHMKIAQGTSEAAIMRTVRQELRLLDDRLPVLSLMTMRDHRDASISLWMVKTAALLFGSIGLVAVFLALVGVYGVKAYLVSRRTREIGIRMSLGATPRDVLWLVLREGVFLTLAGVGIGLVLASGVSFLLKGMIYEVGALDPLTFTAAPLLLAVVTLLACYFPARRAMKVAPVRALRFE
jgi:predicted permease